MKQLAGIKLQSPYPRYVMAGMLIVKVINLNVSLTISHERNWIASRKKS